ncbi:MAG: LacI family DNA-binding transcriptional regulator, partial [Salana multivorans]|nr:LacI family DNA-binding transcriptional regulator [Salana multivorans]
MRSTGPARGRPTSRDVARLAGVGQSTVSYVLSGTGRISAETRRRVLDAAATLGYRPNLTARSMRTGRTGRLALLLATPGEARGGLLSAASRAATDAGYTLDMRTVPTDSTRAAVVREVLDSGLYEGVLSFVPLDDAEGRPDAPTATDGPAVVVLADTFDAQMRVTGPAIGPEPIRELVAGLAARGHRRFLHLAGGLDFRSAQARRDAYLASVTELGLTDLGVVECGWAGARALEVVRGLPEDLAPVAMGAANDILSTAAVRGLTARGMRVPA